MQTTGLSRRGMLAAMASLAVSSKAVLGAAACCPGKAGIALQLYTLRALAKADLDGTLKQAADMGWKCVQWSGMPELPADQIRAKLDKAGLKCVMGRISIEKFEKNFDEQLAFWKTVGCKDVAPGGMMKDCTKDLEGWLSGCRRLDALGAKLREAGMRLSFHNHGMEFEKFPSDPRTKHEILMTSAKPGNLCAELDLGWAFAAGMDVPALVRKLKGRCPMVHAKDLVVDGKKNILKPLGQGQLNWKEIFAAGKEAGIEWYIYEQDNGEGSPLDYTRASYEFLSKQAI